MNRSFTCFLLLALACYSCKEGNDTDFEPYQFCNDESIDITVLDECKEVRTQEYLITVDSLLFTNDKEFSEWIFDLNALDYSCHSFNPITEITFYGNEFMINNLDFLGIESVFFLYPNGNDYFSDYAGMVTEHDSLWYLDEGGYALRFSVSARDCRTKYIAVEYPEIKSVTDQFSYILKLPWKSMDDEENKAYFNEHIDSMRVKYTYGIPKTE